MPYNSQEELLLEGVWSSNLEQCKTYIVDTLNPNAKRLSEEIQNFSDQIVRKIDFLDHQRFIIHGASILESKI